MEWNKKRLKLLTVERASAVLLILMLWAQIVIAQPSVVTVPVPIGNPVGRGLYDGGWIGGQLGFVGAEGLWLRITPELDSWTVQRFPNAENSIITAVAAMSDTVAFALGDQLGQCYRTIDGGHQWERIALPEARRFDHLVVTPFLVAMIDDQDRLWISTDQGHQWSIHQLSVIPRTLDAQDSLLVIVGETMIGWSEDYGNSWQYQPIGIDGASPIQQIVLMQDSVWILIDRGDQLWITGNAGQSWNTVQIERREQLTQIVDIVFQDFSTGWLLAQAKSSSDTVWLWKTTNGGRSWQFVGDREERVAKPYPTVLRALLVAAGKVLCIGERQGQSLILWQDTARTFRWRAALWNPTVAQRIIRGGEVINGCAAVRLVLGDPTGSAVLEYEANQWQTITTLPVIDVSVVTPEGETLQGVRAGRLFRSGEQWFIAPADPAPYAWWSDDGGTTWQVRDLSPVTIRETFAYAPAGIGIIGERDHSRVVLFSDDGGQHWEELSGLDTALTLYAARFATRQLGWCVVQTTGGMELWKTTDGGRSWTKRNLQLFFYHTTADTLWQQYVDQLIVYDRRRVELLLGGEIRRNGRSGGFTLGLWSSTDGGDSWQLRWWIDQLVPQWQRMRGKVKVQVAFNNRREKVMLITAPPNAQLLLYTHNGIQWQQFELAPASDSRTYALIDYDNGCACIVANAMPDQALPSEMLMVRFPEVAAISDSLSLLSPCQYQGAIMLTAGQRYIRLPLSMPIRSLRIALFNLYGRKLWHQQGRQPTVSLPPLPSGSYVLRVEGDNLPCTAFLPLIIVR